MKNETTKNNLQDNSMQLQSQLSEEASMESQYSLHQNDRVVGSVIMVNNSNPSDVVQCTTQEEVEDLEKKGYKVAATAVNNSDSNLVNETNKENLQEKLKQLQSQLQLSKDVGQLESQYSLHQNDRVVGSVIMVNSSNPSDVVQCTTQEEVEDLEKKGYKVAATAVNNSDSNLVEGHFQDIEKIEPHR